MARYLLRLLNKNLTDSKKESKSFKEERNTRTYNNASTLRCDMCQYQVQEQHFSNIPEDI